MRIFLAGATGALGTRLVPLLLAAGHEVTGMTRTAAKADGCARPARRRSSRTDSTATPSSPPSRRPGPTRSSTS